MNRAWERMFGVSRQDLIGQNLSGLTPEIAPCWLNLFSEVSSSGAAVRRERYSSVYGNRWLDIYCYSPGKDLLPRA